MSKLVFIVGGAGAGKTTLAKAVASRKGAAFFDMDTLLRPAAEALMTQAGLDPSDRDSADYKRLCRDLGYRLTMDAALENVALGNDAFVVGPFTRELSDPAWLGAELSRLGSAEVEVKVAVVTLKDEEAYKRRIRERNSELDRWKLEHWDEFRRSLAVRRPAWPLPEGAVLYLDNSGADVEDGAERLERFIYEGTAKKPLS